MMDDDPREGLLLSICGNNDLNQDYDENETEMIRAAVEALVEVAAVSVWSELTHELQQGGQYLVDLCRHVLPISIMQTCESMDLYRDWDKWVLAITLWLMACLVLAPWEPMMGPVGKTGTGTMNHHHHDNNDDDNSTRGSWEETSNDAASRTTPPGYSRYFLEEQETDEERFEKLWNQISSTRYKRLVLPPSCQRVEKSMTTTPTVLPATTTSSSSRVSTTTTATTLAAAAARPPLVQQQPPHGAIQSSNSTATTITASGTTTTAVVRPLASSDEDNPAKRLQIYLAHFWLLLRSILAHDYAEASGTLLLWIQHIQYYRQQQNPPDNPTVSEDDPQGLEEEENTLNDRMVVIDDDDDKNGPEVRQDEIHCHWISDESKSSKSIAESTSSSFSIISPRTVTLEEENARDASPLPAVHVRASMPSTSSSTQASAAAASPLLGQRDHYHRLSPVKEIGRIPLECSSNEDHEEESPGAETQSEVMSTPDTIPVIPLRGATRAAADDDGPRDASNSLYFDTSSGPLSVARPQKQLKPRLSTNHDNVLFDETEQDISAVFLPLENGQDDERVDNQQLEVGSFYDRRRLSPLLPQVGEPEVYYNNGPSPGVWLDGPIKKRRPKHQHEHFFETVNSMDSLKHLTVKISMPDKNGYILGDDHLPDSRYTPLLVFVNSRAGPQQGQLLITQLRRLLNPIQIWDLAQGGPQIVLESFLVFTKLRILVCGGDGTVAWIIDALEKMKLQRKWPPIAVLPLGTGNDLARIHGWGGGYNNESLIVILEQISESYISLLDRWEMTIEDAKSNKTHVKSFINYLGVGADAQAALQVHYLRESRPEWFFSRLVNKAWYGIFGAEDIIKASSTNIHREVTLCADGVRVPLPPDSQGIILLNIDSYAGGVPLWLHGQKNYEEGFGFPSLSFTGQPPRTRTIGDLNGQRTGRTLSMERVDSSDDLEALTAEDKFDRVTACNLPSSCQDGMLEVVSIRGAFHLGQIKVGLSTAQKICQCREAKIVIRNKISVQIDGEPWRQNPCTLRISRKKESAVMLHRSSDDGGVETEMSKLLEWAEERKLIDSQVHSLLMKEFSRRIESKTRQRRRSAQDNIMFSLKRAIGSTGAISSLSGTQP